MAQAFPASTFRGTDATPGRSRPLAHARRSRACRHRSSSKPPTRDAFTGGPYDLVTMFDCLHDMGDPVGAARHVRDVIADDGTWMIVEPTPAITSRTT